MIPKILIGLAVLTVGGIGLYNVNKTETYIAPEKITETVIEEVDALEATIQEAISASSTDIKAQAQEAYDATVQKLEKEIELNVRRGQKKLLDKEIEDLEKEVGVY